MAIAMIFLGSIAGVLAALVSLLMSDGGLLQALTLYLAIATVPVALVFAGLYIQMLFTRAPAPDDAEAQVQTARI